MKWVLVLMVLMGGAGYGWYLNRPGTDAPLYQAATLSRGELFQSVTASGQLNPVVKVEVGSQISGSIQKLFADFNSPVKEGQIVARIDPATYEAALIQAEGSLATAKAALELAQINANRAKALRAENLIPQSDYDKSLADLHQAEATVKVNDGALKKAQVDLARCTIFSPIDGVVISRNVNVGQTVAASLSAPVLFVIANDLAKMQIEAQVAEADIGSVEVGQAVNFTVDAFSGETFTGKVVQIRSAPITDQNVVTYDTVIGVNNPNLKLKPGMTANVSIIVAQRENALRIPNAALRFRPPPTAEIKPADPSPLALEGAPKSDKTSAHGAHKKDKRKAGRTVYVLCAAEPSAPGAKREVLRPVQIKTGVSDGSYTEVLEGLNEGDELAAGMKTAKESPKRIAGLFGVAGKKH